MICLDGVGFMTKSLSARQRLELSLHVKSKVGLNIFFLKGPELRVKSKGGLCIFHKGPALKSAVVTVAASQLSHLLCYDERRQPGSACLYRHMRARPGLVLS